MKICAGTVPLAALLTGGASALCGLQGCVWLVASCLWCQTAMQLACDFNAAPIPARPQLMYACVNRSETSGQQTSGQRLNVATCKQRCSSRARRQTRQPRLQHMHHPCLHTIVVAQGKSME